MLQSMVEIDAGLIYWGIYASIGLDDIELINGYDW